MCRNVTGQNYSLACNISFNKTTLKPNHLLSFISSELTVLSGTAVSSSHVAGTAALMKSGNKQLTPILIKSRIMANGIADVIKLSRGSPVRRLALTKRLFISKKLIE